MISFIAFPIVIGIKICTQYSKIAIIIFVLYAIAGIIRLAWFNIKTKEDITQRYYQGLPVTYIALILPIVYIIGFFIHKDLFSILLLITYIIVTILFILNIKIPKPTGKWYIFFGILAVSATIIIIFLSNGTILH